jgi:hypothetical protein
MPSPDNTDSGCKQLTSNLGLAPSEKWGCERARSTRSSVELPGRTSLDETGRKIPARSLPHSQSLCRGSGAGGPALQGTALKYS